MLKTNEIPLAAALLSMVFVCTIFCSPNNAVLSLPKSAIKHPNISTKLESSSLNQQNRFGLCARFHGWGMPGLLEFASPNHPKPYPFNVDCVRTIQAPAGYDILLHFGSVFEIEAAYGGSLRFFDEVSCPNDYLEVRDGRYSFSPLLARLCGTAAPTEALRARSGFLWLHFHSDSYISQRGFSARYEFVRTLISSRKFPTPTQCHRSIALPLDAQINLSTVLNTYSNQSTTNYSFPLECTWRIDAPKSFNIVVYTEEFELASPNQCRDNYLEVYAGLVASSSMAKYCSSGIAHVYSGQSTVMLRFFARSPAHLHGSRMRVLLSTYAAVKNCTEHGLFPCGDDFCIPRELVCNGNANCLFRRDETNCAKERGVLQSLVTSDRSPLFIAIGAISLAVMALCIRYRPFASNVQHHDVEDEGHLLGGGCLKTTNSINLPNTPGGRHPIDHNPIEPESPIAAITRLPATETYSSFQGPIPGSEFLLSPTNLDLHHPNCDRIWALSNNNRPDKSTTRCRSVSTSSTVHPTKASPMGNGPSALGPTAERDKRTLPFPATDDREGAIGGKLRLIYLSSSCLHEIPHTCTFSYEPPDFLRSSNLPNADSPS